MAESLLHADGIAKSFGNVQALLDIDVRLESGQIHGIVGPNGAGKTTLLSVLSGYLLPNAGRVLLEGKDITRYTPQRRVPLGIVRTFQNIRLFGGLSVEQNIRIGQHTRARTGFTSLLPIRTAGEKQLARELTQAMELFELTPYRKRRAGELPYGVQKQLEMARAMATRPRIILLDEPAAGMTTDGREALTHRIRQVRDEGVSVIVVEHDMDVISKVCDTVTVLNFGRMLTSGPPPVVLASDEVRTAYLGA